MLIFKGTFSKEYLGYPPSHEKSETLEKNKIKDPRKLLRYLCFVYGDLSA